ncbi:hypothetical protein CYMTET_53655 [Cymbomonas tetramitiformis]|uniref:Transmembrane protein n=1 Tax=Cymbomonas tetramitiformis TaxID=36881 RepID=A0AAE0BHP2_9CHLO|nr:hypothetical protein CYMTET_53655 [Cymbomonas tetramitiformis]
MQDFTCKIIFGKLTPILEGLKSFYKHANMFGVRLSSTTLFVIFLGLLVAPTEADDFGSRKLLGRGRRPKKAEPTYFPPLMMYPPMGEQENFDQGGGEGHREQERSISAGPGHLTKEQAIAEFEDDGPLFALFIGAVFIAGGIILGYYLYKTQGGQSSVAAKRPKVPRGNVSDLKNKLEKLREVTSALES